MGQFKAYEGMAQDVLMLIITVVVVAVLSLVLPGIIETAGYTGSAGTIVALIPMFIPVALLLAMVGKMFGFLHFGGN
jgi:hypothetical protein